jgi:far upstream element-binding protein
MAKAQAIADKAVAEHAARTKDTEEPRERDFSREDAEKRARSRSRSREREREPEQTEMLPPRAFGAPGAPVVVEGTGGHEGRIIGRGGANIKDMQARYQVNIQIKRPEGVTEVTGVGAEACANEIRKIIEDAKALAGGGGAPNAAAPVTDPNAVTETIMCDGVEGRIIGKGGQNIRALMERTGARVKVYSDRHICEILRRAARRRGGGGARQRASRGFPRGGAGRGHRRRRRGRRYGRARGLRARGGGVRRARGLRPAAAGVRRLRPAAAGLRRATRLLSRRTAGTPRRPRRGRL